MRDHERAMLAYAMLADLSRRKRQAPGRGRFLVLAAAEACRAGWPEVAAACRAQLLCDNPHHLLGRSATMAEALRDPEFQPLLKQLERFCGPERAEHLLAQLGALPEPPESNPPLSRGEYALRILRGEP